MVCARPNPRRPLGARGVLFVLLVALLIAPWLPLAGGDPDGDGLRHARPLAPTHGVWFSEVVTHPYSDWDGNDRVSATDEYLVLRNFGSSPVDVTGWVLQMIDTTPEELALSGLLAPGEARVVLNPPGRINNDVQLVLLDAAGMGVDSVTLGQNGIPGGRGDDVRDEAVHLAGPWAALRAPGTLGRGLDAAFALRAASAAVVEIGDPALLPGWFESPWFSTATQLAVEIVSAPGHEGATFTHLSVAGATFPLAAMAAHPGWWSTPVVDLPAGELEVPIMLHAASGVSSSFPSGALMVLRQELDPPRFVPFDASGALFAVADQTGRVHAFPQLAEGASGVQRVDVYAVQGDASTLLPGCLPLAEPGPSCSVDDPAAALLRVEVVSATGIVVIQELPVALWDTPPEVPGVHFRMGPPPNLEWDAPVRALRSITLEYATAPGSAAAPVAVLPGNVTRAIDEAWTPGEPRSYRLHVVDLAGNEATGPWHLLDPVHVPVQVQWDVEAAALLLADDGTASVQVKTDRALAVAPRLVLDVVAPQPFTVALAMNATAEPGHYVAVLALPPGAPREAIGTWRLDGGVGVDGAPIVALEAPAFWDREPPRVTVTGAPASWLAATSHTFTLHVEDGVDANPVLNFTALPSIANVTGAPGAQNVTVHGDGEHEVAGVATDAHGNAAPFSVWIRLDATAPVVVEHARPSQWSAASPIILDVRDEASGVDRESLQVWVRNASTEVQGEVAAWDDALAHIVPPAAVGSVTGPYELYVAVADHAGNPVEGLLSGESGVMATAPAAPVSGANGGPTGSGAAPSFLGPLWGAGRDGSGDGDAGAGGDGGPAGGSAAPAAGQGGSGNQAVWDALAARAAPGDDAGASFAWVLLGLAGTVGLGTIVHRARRGQKGRAPPPSAATPPPGHADAAAPAPAQVDSEASWSYAPSARAACGCPGGDLRLDATPAASLSFSVLVAARDLPAWR